MYQDQTSKKLIDIMGNLTLDAYQKALGMLQVMQEVAPDKQPDYYRVIMECYGLAPRHESPSEVEKVNEALIERVEKAAQGKVDYQVKGWFEVNADRPVEKNIVEMCYFLEEWTDVYEKAVVLKLILATSFVPIPTNYFSRYTDEGSDSLLIREHASSYIKMRQLLNLKVGPTTRGSLLLDFLNEVSEEGPGRAIIVGAFIEELLRRLRKQTQPPAQAQGAPPVNPLAGTGFDFNMDPSQMQDMMQKMQSILPPDVLEQLRKLFGGEGGFDR
ncbi:MAG: hypothetical protein HQL32_17665 [Planctomycetes bacterium]|nr:hypothetical protein [Planctomycetota bacterium]